MKSLTFAPSITNNKHVINHVKGQDDTIVMTTDDTLHTHQVLSISERVNYLFLVEMTPLLCHKNQRTA